jgi:hypothetical protein
LSEEDLMRSLLGWMLSAVVILGHAQVAGAQVAVSVSRPYVTYGTPLGYTTNVVPAAPVASVTAVVPAAPVASATTYYSPAYVPGYAVPAFTTYSSAYRGFVAPLRTYRRAPVAAYATSYVAPTTFVGPLGRVKMRFPRRAVFYYP